MGSIPRADPAATPRIGYSGSVTRGKAIFSITGGDPQWKVEIVPLEGATTVGRPLTGGGEAPRATFEVRAEFRGRGLEAFEPVPGGVQRVEQWNTADQELAKAIAMAAIDELRAGREPVLVQLAARFQGRP
ncbi:MAG TPA: hypothetical protein VFI17_03445 [Solirubrobacterales bacterium]|nr:hypothetical protein [Solirubrobacterales bacterium]